MSRKFPCTWFRRAKTTSTKIEYSGAMTTAAHPGIGLSGISVFKAMAERMAQTLRTPSWQTPLPVPTVDRKDKRFRSNGFWRGDVWPPTNYQVASGLAAYGHKDLAAEIADKTVANALKHGISEHYDSISGKPLGVKFLGMSCTIITMMLDGLTRNYKLKTIETT